MPEPKKRLLASYGRRRGRRLRPSRQGLMDELLPQIEISNAEMRKCRSAEELSAFLHIRTSTLWLEIGFGAGEHLAHQAALHPGNSIIGCEPFINGIATLLARLTSPPPIGGRQGGGHSCSNADNGASQPPPQPSPYGGGSNIRIFNGDVRLLTEKLPDASLDKVFILYPDPWPKARHHKRRLISTEFLNGLARVMKPGAELRLATDDEDYLTWMLEHLLSHPSFIWTAKTCDDWQKPWPDWISTRYEQKALKARRVPTYLSFSAINGIGLAQT